jgi:riboflavin kinase / FMN adenylyltransferase
MPEDAQALEIPKTAGIATADRRVGPMQVVLGLRRLAGDAGRLFVVVGVFDGIHRGHSYLLGQLRRHAGRRAARPTVITFDAHPDEVLVGEAPPLICDPDERLMRLSAAGVDVTVIEHFDQALRMTPYDGFIRMITERTPLVGLLMTPEAAFGHERRGTPDALSELGAREGFEVVVVPSFTLEGVPVSSSAVRSAIAGGDLEAASHLLGRPYALVGEAGEGRGAGRRVTFSLPVALPPDDDYPVDITPFPARGSSGSIRGAARIASGVVEIDPEAHGRVRVEFRSG